MRFRAPFQILFIAAIALCIALPALAHDPSLSGIRIVYRDADVVVNVTTHISRLLRSEGGTKAMSPAALDQAIRKRLHVTIDGQEIQPKSANVIGDNANDLLTWQTIVPIHASTCEVLSRLYPEDPASRTVVSVVRGGQTVREAFLDDQHPNLLQSQALVRQGAIALRYVREGVLHIFGGPDHILFVLGLLLLGGTLKSLLKTITAFTLAHSVTLSLAATGVLSPAPRIVEPVIALSIVAIAMENLRQERKQPCVETEDRDLRPYYAFGFGLIHGFGFAGALAEVGLPKASLGVALASFNIGVEIGQACIVLAAFPLLNLFKSRRTAAFVKFAYVVSILIGIAGGYWFVTRLFPGLT